MLSMLKTPQLTGKYLISDKYGHIDVDYWFKTKHKEGDGWNRHYEEDVMAWCLLVDIKPYNPIKQ